MRTVLQRRGDTYVLEFSEETIAEWGIDPEATLEVTVTGGVLTIVPVGDAALSEKIDVAMARLAERYDATFKKLAE